LAAANGTAEEAVLFRTISTAWLAGMLTIHLLMEETDRVLLRLAIRSERQSYLFVSCLLLGKGELMARFSRARSG
jgi:hypothetical protein